MMNRRDFLVTTTSLAGLAACSPRGDDDIALLRVATAGLPDSLDPAIGQLAASALIYKQIHGPLTDYGPDGGLAPGLAESWAVENDGLRWIFTLRENLSWSDGRPLTTEDIVWSARRIVNPASTFAAVGDFYAVVNAQAVLTGDARPDALGVTAIDERRVAFDLTTPVGFFPLLMREFYPFPRHKIESHGSAWTAPDNFVGCGPYVPFRSTALSLELRPNPRAWNPGRAEQIHVESVEDPATRARLFRAGDYDIAEAPLATQVAFLRSQLGDQMRSFAAPKFTYLKCNLDRELTGQLAVRRALELAIDRDFIARELLVNTATATRHIIPGEDYSAVSMMDMRASASAILRDAGLTGANAPHIQLRCLSGDRERIAIALADDWTQIGINVDILATPAADLYPALDGGDYDVALAHFDRGLKTDPNFMMEPFAQGGFADNTFWFGQPGPADEFFSDLIRRARESVESERRSTLYRAAETQMLNQQVIIPLLHERAFWLVANRVEGVSEAIQPMLWRDMALSDT